MNLFDKPDPIAAPWQFFCPFCRLTIAPGPDIESRARQHAETCREHPLTRLVMALEIEVQWLREAIDGYERALADYRG